MERETVSRRLKAARWLAGDRRNGRGQVIPLTATELAQREQLQRNRITASRIEEIEQERVDAREMELEQIALALGMARDYFRAPMPLSSPDLQAALDLLGLAPGLAAQARAQEQERAREAGEEEDRPPGQAGGAGG